MGNGLLLNKSNRRFTLVLLSRLSPLFFRGGLAAKDIVMPRFADDASGKHRRQWANTVGISDTVKKSGDWVGNMYFWIFAA